MYIPVHGGDDRRRWEGEHVDRRKNPRSRWSRSSMSISWCWRCFSGPTPRTRAAFGMTAEQAEQTKVLAGNQGSTTASSPPACLVAVAPPRFRDGARAVLPRLRARRRGLRRVHGEQAHLAAAGAAGGRGLGGRRSSCEQRTTFIGTLTDDAGSFSGAGLPIASMRVRRDLHLDAGNTPDAMSIQAVAEIARPLAVFKNGKRTVAWRKPELIRPH